MKIATRADHLELDDLKARVERAVVHRRRKKRERRVAHPTFKNIFEGLTVKRVYKDQVTFVFKDEDEFFSTLRTILERHDLENRAP